MKNIRSVVLLAVVALAGSFAFADIPEFTGPNADKAFIVDPKPVKGKNSDFIQIINFTDDTSAVFEVWGYKKAWEKIGDTKPVDYANQYMMETEFDHKLDKFKYFAIVSKDGKEYKYDYSKFVLNMYVVKHYCGSFRILPADAVPGKNAFTIENKAVKGSFKDRIRIVNETGTKKPSFKIYGSNDNSTWELVAGTTVTPDDDDDEEASYCEAVNEKTLASYKFYAIESRDGAKYNYEVSKAHNDLYITVKK